VTNDCVRQSGCGYIGITGSTGVDPTAATGSTYWSLLVGTPTIANANATDQAVNATDNYITGSSLAIENRVKVGTTLRWRFSVTKTATGTVTPQLAVRFGVGGTVTDTARCAITFPSVQTAATDTGTIDVEAIVRATGASAVVQAVSRFIHKGDTTGFATLACPQVVQALSTGFDITTTGMLAGISVHPGATGAWTFQTVSAEASNLA
jgi:hypothetical protein